MACPRKLKTRITDIHMFKAIILMIMLAIKQKKRP